MTSNPLSGDALLLEPATRITCPGCEREFSLEEGFARKSLEAIEAASHGALDDLRARLAADAERRAEESARQSAALLQQRLRNLQELLDAQAAQGAEALERMRCMEQETAAQREQALRRRLADQDEQLQAAEQARAALAAKERQLVEQEATLGERVEREAAARAETLAARERETLSAEIAARDEQIVGYRTAELLLRKERAELEQRQQQLELDVQRRMDEERRQIADTARAAEAEKARLREADLQKKLDDAQARAGEMQRQLEQGSQQLQGEVLELLLERELSTAFPVDLVTEVRKGARGGDAVHTVRTRSEQVAGLVLWEAKRAARWSHAWAPKLKEDMRQCGAVAGVVVTTAFPPDWPEGQPFGLHEGVWVTSAPCAIALAAVLREGLLETHKARLAAANKGESMEAVYDYLTSPQFAHKLRAVYEVFGKLRDELNAERTAMLQRWKRREKQIELATVQLVGIAGDLQGLAQQDLPALELEPQALEAPVEAADLDAETEEQT
jgi:hypothetical protein